VARQLYDIDVFSAPLGQWQYAHTYQFDAPTTDADVVARFVAANPHRSPDDVRVSLRVSA